MLNRILLLHLRTLSLRRVLLSHGLEILTGPLRSLHFRPLKHSVVAASATCLCAHRHKDLVGRAQTVL